MVIDLHEFFKRGHCLERHFTDKIIKKASLTKLCEDLLYQDPLESGVIWKKCIFI
jgi:hypothetical protein